MSPTDAPPIARLRTAADPLYVAPFVMVQKSDLRYALARVDEVCLGCMVIDTVKAQAATIERQQQMIDLILAERRGQPVAGVVELRTCPYPEPSCCHDGGCCAHEEITR